MRQPYRIESVTLKDIGVFEHTHFDFPPIQSEQRDGEKAEIHIFTGPNGCGKSTVLYALAASFDFFNDNTLIKKRFHGKTSSVLYKFAQGLGAYTPDIDADFFPGEASLKRRCLVKDFAFYGDERAVSLITPIAGAVNEKRIAADKKYSFAAFSYSGSSSPNSRFHIDSIKELESSPFNSALSFEKTARPDVLAQWVANNKAKSAFAYAENLKQEAEKYDVALNKITQFIKEISDIDFSFKVKRTPLQVVTITDGQELNYDVLPEGLKSIINWIGDVALRLENIPFEEERDIFSQPVVLFLDEVDIHLHPKWQRRILPAIQKLLPNAQVFVSTHSPFVVGSVEDAWVYRLPDPQRNVMRDASLADKIVPTESGAGKSIQLILEEIFDVDERFDVETEQLLKSFKLARNRYLQNPEDDSELMHLAQTIRERGEELETIIEMELRQIARRLKK